MNRHISAIRLFSTFGAVTAFVTPVFGQLALSTGLGAENISFEFATDNGWVYDGRIELPALGRRNGFAVVMLGGGLGSPIDWAIPGIMTLDGNATHDADTIARALLDAGFVVARWQAVRRGDPKFAEDGLMMDVPPFQQTIEQARNAFAAFREKTLVADSHIFLLSHSLGARRAAILLEENPKIAGLVMLAGASLIPSDLEAARKIVAEASQAQKQIGSGDRHESIARIVDQRRNEWFKPFLGTKDKHGLLWAAEVIAKRDIPTLLAVGELDERWLVECYMVTSQMQREGAKHFVWKVYPNLGHQLGPEILGPVEHKDFGVIANSRTGPIDPQVVADLVNWLIVQVKARS